MLVIVRTYFFLLDLKFLWLKLVPRRLFFCELSIIKSKESNSDFYNYFIYMDMKWRKKPK